MEILFLLDNLLFICIISVIIGIGCLFIKGMTDIFAVYLIGIVLGTVIGILIQTLIYWFYE